MSGSPARRPAIEDLVDAYRADLVAAGMFAGHPVTSVARMFFIRVGPEGWARLPLAAQCALPLKDRRVVGWLESHGSAADGGLRRAVGGEADVGGAGRPGAGADGRGPDAYGAGDDEPDAALLRVAWRGPWPITQLRRSNAAS